MSLLSHLYLFHKRTCNDFVVPPNLLILSKIVRPYDVHEICLSCAHHWWFWSALAVSSQRYASHPSIPPFGGSLNKNRLGYKCEIDNKKQTWNLRCKVWRTHSIHNQWKSFKMNRNHHPHPITAIQHMNFSDYSHVVVMHHHSDSTDARMDTEKQFEITKSPPSLQCWRPRHHASCAAAPWCRVAIGWFGSVCDEAGGTVGVGRDRSIGVDDRGAIKA